MNVKGNSRRDLITISCQQSCVNLVSGSQDLVQSFLRNLTWTVHRAVFSEKKWCFFGSKCLLPSYFLNLILIIYLFTQSLIINHHPSTPKEDYRICGQNPMVLQFKTNLLYLLVLCISNAVSTLSLCSKSDGVTIQMKSLQQYLYMVLFKPLWKWKGVVLSRVSNFIAEQGSCRR